MKNWIATEIKKDVSVVKDEAKQTKIDKPVSNNDLSQLIKGTEDLLNNTDY